MMNNVNTLHPFYLRLLGLVFIVASVNSGVTQAFNYLLSMRGESISAYMIFATMCLAILPGLMVGFVLLLWRLPTISNGSNNLEIPLGNEAQRILLKILLIAVGLYFVASSFSDVLGIIFKYLFLRDFGVSQGLYLISFSGYLSSSEDGRFFCVDIGMVFIGALLVGFAKRLSNKLVP